MHPCLNIYSTRYTVYWQSDMILQWTIFNTSPHKHICKIDSQHVCAHAWHVLAFCGAIFMHVMVVFFCGLGHVEMHGWTLDICTVLRAWVYLCVSNYVWVHLFVSVLMNYVSHVQMYKYWCFGWRWRTHVAEAQCLRWMCEARHRTACIIYRHIRPDKRSHGAAHLTHSNGGWLSWEAGV